VGFLGVIGALGPIVPKTLKWLVRGRARAPPQGPAAPAGE